VARDLGLVQKVRDYVALALRWMVLGRDHPNYRALEQIAGHIGLDGYEWDNDEDSDAKDSVAEDSGAEGGARSQPIEDTEWPTLNYGDL
jgi:hypothetical protein